jgi:hypothetical protein
MSPLLTVAMVSVVWAKAGAAAKSAIAAAIASMPCYTEFLPGGNKQIEHMLLC